MFFPSYAVRLHVFQLHIAQRLALLSLSILINACSPPEETESTLLVSDILSSIDNEGFKKVTEKRAFIFPEDHGPHPEYKNEWWYVTGNLTDTNDRQFGYQVTFFRISLSSTALSITDRSSKKVVNTELNHNKKTSAWRSHQIWMAHFAITDVNNESHTSRERLVRQALNLSGASSSTTSPFKVWLDDWQLVAQNNDSKHGFPWQLSIKAQEQGQNLGLALELNATKPLVLQGNDGLSQKSEKIGNASYYYSFTRLNTQGTLTLNNQTYKVTGNSWLDREWGSSLLDKDQVGWDWLSLQLDSNEELLYYQLRTNSVNTNSVNTHPSSQGKWIDQQGNTKTISAKEVILTPLSWWTAPDGKRFPIRWRLRYPERRADWIISALVDNQYMTTSVRYWEGAVKVMDRKTERVLGLGYLEMTGY